MVLFDRAFIVNEIKTKQNKTEEKHTEYKMFVERNELRSHLHRISLYLTYGIIHSKLSIVRSSHYKNNIQ